MIKITEKERAEWHNLAHEINTKAIDSINILDGYEISEVNLSYMQDQAHEIETAVRELRFLLHRKTQYVRGVTEGERDD